MSNILTAALLLAVANDFFEVNPMNNEVFVTEDGQPFILENRASIHADQNNLTYKKYLRSFDQEETSEGETHAPVEEVEAPKQPNVLEAKNPELRGSNLQESEKAKEVAEQKAAEIDLDENYESVAAIIAKIPGLNLEQLNEYLSKENTSETPRKTLVKALTEAIASLETSQNPE